VAAWAGKGRKIGKCPWFPRCAILRAYWPRCGAAEGCAGSPCVLPTLPTPRTGWGAPRRPAPRTHRREGGPLRTPDLPRVRHRYRPCRGRWPAHLRHSLPPRGCGSMARIPVDSGGARHAQHQHHVMSPSTRASAAGFARLLEGPGDDAIQRSARSNPMPAKDREDVMLLEPGERPS